MGTRVLLAEDEALIALSLADLLEAEGYEVALALDGAEALDAARRLGDALDALVTEHRQRAQCGLEALEETRRGLLAVARWSPPDECPHDLVSRDVREWTRQQELQRVRRKLDVVVDRYHVNCHVPWNLLTLQRPLRRLTVRLLVTGAEDDRPTLVLPRATDVTAAASGIAVRRLASRCAAFSLYDDERVEVPLWRLQASGWSREPGEVWAAVRLFQTLWDEAVPWAAPDQQSRQPVPSRDWPETHRRPGADVGSAP